MDQIKKERVAVVLDKLAEKSQQGVTEILALREDIQRYETALRKYAEFKDAEEFLHQGKLDLSKQHETLDNLRLSVLAQQKDVQEESIRLQQKEDEVRIKFGDINRRTEILEKKEQEIAKLKTETEHIQKNAKTHVEGLTTWENRLGEREARFSKRWTALKTLMETHE